eukprot:12432-Eustigmatos_ZCMA.PRE.1
MALLFPIPSDDRNALAAPHSMTQLLVDAQRGSLRTITEPFSILGLIVSSTDPHTDCAVGQLIVVKELRGVTVL